VKDILIGPMVPQFQKAARGKSESVSVEIRMLKYLKGKLNPRIKKLTVPKWSIISKLYLSIPFSDNGVFKANWRYTGKCLQLHMHKILYSIFFHQKTRTGPLIQILISC
jgi:hypothetical protein